MKSFLTFGEALDMMNHRNRVQRDGWNGKGMYLFLVRNWSTENYGDDVEQMERLPFIAMKTADNKIVPWLASQTDMLAIDWSVVD